MSRFTLWYFTARTRGACGSSAGRAGAGEGPPEAHAAPLLGATFVVALERRLARVGALWGKHESSWVQHSSRHCAQHSEPEQTVSSDAPVRALHRSKADTQFQHSSL